MGDHQCPASTTPGLAVPPVYHGKLTACHTQAVFTAFFHHGCLPEGWLFEALTTVPFGVVSVAGDPNRILNCNFDPDLGLDRAFRTLGLGYELSFQPPHADPAQCLQNLRSWIREGSVVIGPLNMDCLPHLFARHLYAGCDHFLTIWGSTKKEFWVTDTEGSACEVLAQKDLVEAWRADRVPEGRGAFVMRRIRSAKGVRHPPRGTLLQQALSQVALNLRDAAQQKRGGAAAYVSIAAEAEEVRRTPALRRGLTYAIPTRIQRLVCQQRFFTELASWISGPNIQDAVDEILESLRSQITGLASILEKLLERDTGHIEEFGRLGELEHRLTEAIMALEASC